MEPSSNLKSKLDLLESEIYNYKKIIITMVSENFDSNKNIFSDLHNHLKEIQDNHSFFNINLFEANKMKDAVNKSKKTFENKSASFKKNILKELDNQKKEILKILNDLSKSSQKSIEQVDSLISQLQKILKAFDFFLSPD